MQFTTRAEAVAALTAIRGGEDFVNIARTKSLAKGSATAGNSNCLDEATLPAELVKPVKNAQPGVVTEPVKYSTGYALLKLSTPFVPPPLSEVRAQIIAALQQQDQSVSIFAKKLYSEAVVKVDPTIGIWKPDPQNQGQFGVLAIPGNAPKGTPNSRPTQLSVQNERHSAPKVKP